MKLGRTRTRTTTDQKPPHQRCAAAELWRGDAEDGKMGFEKEILKAGTGPKPVKGQKVTVHCTGYGKDGDLSKKFWSTKDPGQQPFSFNIGLGSVIKGWDEGVMGMQLGEVARLTCLCCSAPQTTLMDPVAFQPGEFNQTPC
ncbi:hypothetical protein ACQJBY_055651 [Aegilops geniculata]